MITIEVDKKGIKRVTAMEGSVAESQENSDLLRITALPRQLLHNSVLEAYTGGDDDVVPELDSPEVWVPTNRDGEIDVPRKMTIMSNVLPRYAYECVPAWFVEGCKKLFPNEDWAEVETPFSKEELLSLHKLEGVKDEEPVIGEAAPDHTYFEQRKNLSEEELNKLHDAPYCTRTEERAMSIFEHHVNGFGSERILDHFGWVGECDGDDILVTEPYAVDLEGMTKLCALCNQLGWDCKLKGISGHYPGSTVRLEIQPKRES